MSRPLFSVLVACACALAARPTAAAEADTGMITGVVVNADTGERLPNALVVLQCTCLPGMLEATTNEQGLYAFRELPPGTYTIQVLVGEADVSKVTTLPTSAKFRANFRVDPKASFHRVVRVKETAVPMSASEGGYNLADGMRDMARGSSTSLEAPRSAKVRLAEHRKDTVALRNVPAGTTPPPEEAAPAVLPELEQQQATKPLPDDYPRQVVYSGAMDVAVFDLAKSKKKVEKLVVDAGGWVQSLRGDGMLLRIPSTEFRRVAAAIGKLGRVDRQDFEALDITEDYYDLHTRIEVLRRTQKQLLELLDKARTVEQALAVRRELDKVTLELEAALGRDRVLASQVRFSALSLALAKRIPQTDAPSTNNPFPWVDEIGVEGTAWR